MMYSVIDIGSNTVKCQVYEVIKGCITRKQFYTKQLGIIAKINNGTLEERHIKELTDTINEYKGNVDSTVFCFATESLRKIDNLNEVSDRILNDCALELELISGEDEALLSFNGFLSGTPHIQNGIMVDMGGGSTEILKFENRNALHLNSFKFGCLSLRRDYVSGRFPTAAEIEAINARVASELDGYAWINNTKRLCLIGGTGSAIEKVATELGYTSGPEFTSERFMQLFDYLSTGNDEVTALLEKYIPARIETIVPGMCAYRQIIETVNADTVYISHGGIRDGYLYRKLKGQQ